MPELHQSKASLHFAQPSLFATWQKKRQHKNEQIS